VRADSYGTIRLGKGWRLDQIEESRLIALDLLDADAAARVLERLRPRTVFHTVAYGGYSFQSSPDLIHRTNYLALAQLLEKLATSSVEAFIHAGSSSEYGTNSAAPDEAAPRRPNSAYAAAKSAAAELLSFWGDRHGFPCANLRLYSAYGPFEDSSRFIPRLVEAGLRGELPPLVAPETSRDFIHVDDVVAAFVTAAMRMRPEIRGRSYNIATGRRMSIAEAVAVTRRQLGVAVEPVYGSMQSRSWDLDQWWGNPERAKKDLGWTAQIPFEDGIVQAAGWWKGFLSGHEFSQLTELNTARSRPKVSAVVACYRDNAAIPHMHRRLSETFAALPVDYEIIFVNDNSPDDTEEIIRALSAADPHVRGITHSRNFGSQAAFRSGMEISAGDACVLLDGDLQDPPELIARFVELWGTGNDVIYGRRIAREMNAAQALLYKAFYRVFSAVSYIPIPHDAGDFSLMDRRVVEWLLACDERDSFLRGLRAYVGFKQTGVDYVRPERMFGRSTNNFLKNLGWARKAIFSFSTAPLSLLSLAGFALFGVAVALSIIQVLLKLFAPELVPPGLASTQLMILFFGSLNILGIAVLGEYLGKVLEEVKRRPPFIRSHLISGGRIEPAPMTPRSAPRNGG
jgi:nucleoside-diphosphate-sugar epimerase/glycosyltransferase involved in cell wall biosynthesis